ncbi:OmpA family protein [Futiania mangrovi]|uniref:OmpA family protein n=1 Tax=Futiania mangrovi TaxID=2959716 RepID=A0A9J6PDG6_9PROT|nr:OmpA family protein [Futiania mangrovii]MCP1337437.1 OmpA family protein [Futiania mangrovii]
MDRSHWMKTWRLERQFQERVAAHYAAKGTRRRAPQAQGTGATLARDARRAFLLAFSGIFVTACAGMGLSDPRMNTVIASDPFGRALQERYLALSEAEFQRGDYFDSDIFANRAIAAGFGKPGLPEEVFARALSREQIAEAEGMRKRLIAAIDAGARKDNPALAADAQTAFECWQEEAEENRQPEKIAACKARFETAMETLAKENWRVADALSPIVRTGRITEARDVRAGLPPLGAPMPGYAMPQKPLPEALPGMMPARDARRMAETGPAAGAPAPLVASARERTRLGLEEVARQTAAPGGKRFTVFFDLDADTVTLEAEEVLSEIARILRERPDARIQIRGHADRVGADIYNYALSLRRAYNVRAVLAAMAGGLQADVQGLGESNPAVNTRDGVAEILNRRVDIVLL